MGDVLCIGNLQLDVLCRMVTALPPPGEIRMIDDIDFSLSGNGGSVAAVLGRLGVAVDLAGYSGADMVGEQFRAALNALGVGTDTLLRHPTAGTGTSIVTVLPGGERSIFFVNGANALFDLESIPDDWLRGRRVVALSSVFVLPQFTGETVGALFARARRHGAHTVLNICSDTQRQGLLFLKSALAEADYFILNQDEGEQLTGCREPEEVLEKLGSLTRGVVVLTLGAEGCCLRDEHSGVCYIRAVPVEAMDCTGAGDAFVAGFIAGLVLGEAAHSAASLGCRVASFAVTGSGAYHRTPSLVELTRFVGADG